MEETAAEEKNQRMDIASNIPVIEDEIIRDDGESEVPPTSSFLIKTSLPITKTKVKKSLYLLSLS